MNAKSFAAGQVVRLTEEGKKFYAHDNREGDQEAYAKPFVIIRVINDCAEVLCEDNKERCLWLYDLEQV